MQLIVSLTYMHLNLNLSLWQP